MSAILTVLSTIFTIVFVVGSMVALGLSLTVRQIIAPLRDIGLLVRVLVANFILVPAVALLLTHVIPMHAAYGIGLLLLATAAGAGFLPKLVQLAKGDVAFGVGVMVLLMVVTIVYLPLVLPLLLPGVSVNALDIATSLVVLMVIPLGLALFVKARYAELADLLQPPASQAANMGLVGVVTTMLLLNWRTVLGTIGSGALLAALLLVVASFAVGYVLGPSAASKSVLGLGTAQRNIAAAMVVATENFAAQPDVLIMVLVGSVFMAVLLLPAAGELGKRQTVARDTTEYQSARAEALPNAST